MKIALFIVFFLIAVLCGDNSVNYQQESMGRLVQQVRNEWLLQDTGIDALCNQDGIVNLKDWAVLAQAYRNQSPWLIPRPAQFPAISFMFNCIHEPGYGWRYIPDNINEIEIHLYRMDSGWSLPQIFLKE